MFRKKSSLAVAVKLALAVNASAVGIALPVLVGAEEQAIEEVVVTGSRIPRNDLNGQAQSLFMTEVRLRAVVLHPLGSFFVKRLQSLVAHKLLR